MARRLLQNPRLLLAALGFVVFAALAVTVAAGAVDSVDRAIAGHAAIFAGAADRPSWASSTFPVFPRGYYPDHPAGALAVQLVRIPAAALFATLLYAVGVGVLMFRGNRRGAVTFAVAWVVAIAVEVALKQLIERPPLTVSSGKPSGHISEFDASFPSGQVIRAVLLTGILVTLWPRLVPLLALWVAALGSLLVLGGVHLPTDVIGGLVFALALVVLSGEASRRHFGASPTSPESANGGEGEFV